MQLKNELDLLVDVLKKQRDEIELQLHLVGMDAKEQWRKSETKWGDFVDQLGIINDDTKETSAEVIHATKMIGDELKELYRQIAAKLEK